MRLANRTRYSSSIPARLLREKFYLLPLYYLVRLSDLAREGIENSGSYHFADHIYAGRASGRWGVGTLVDRLLLSLPASRSFHNRYLHSRDRIVDYVRTTQPRECRILSAPCGLPRDLVEAAHVLRDAPIRFYCLDIDPAALDEARRMTASHGLRGFEFIRGDAFDAGAWPREMDIVTSSGFAEFLEDEELIRFYTLCHGALRNGGTLVTSATVRNRLSDYMMTNLAELLTHYREEAALSRIFSRTPFGEVEMRRDAVGYQVLMAAVR